MNNCMGTLNLIRSRSHSVVSALDFTEPQKMEGKQDHSFPFTDGGTEARPHAEFNPTAHRAGSLPQPHRLSLGRPFSTACKDTANASPVSRGRPAVPHSRV